MVEGGVVYAVASTASTLYAGGDFTAAGRWAGDAAVVSASDGAVDPTSPFVRAAGDRNSVTDTVADGEGGWYLALYDGIVDGMPISGVVHVRADGSVDDGFKAEVSGASQYAGVRTIALDGDRLLVGGVFDVVNGQSRRGLAALRASDGALLPFDPSPTRFGNAAEIVEVTAGQGVIYVAGFFDRIGGQSRSALAALDRDTGAVTAFDPHLTDGTFVFPIVPVGPDRVLVRGTFESIGGQPRQSIAMLDAATGDATAWDARPDLPLNDFAVVGDTVYVAGVFSELGGEPRAGLGAVSLATGAPTSWRPPAFEPPYPGFMVRFVDLAVTPGQVHVLGEFSSAGGVPRHNALALRTSDAAVTAWDPSLTGAADIVEAGNKVLVANADGLDVRPRRGLAALDLASGALRSFPELGTGLVTDLAMAGETLYVSGDFTSIAGAPCPYLAGLTTTGSPTGFCPLPDGWVGDLDVAGGLLYAGGTFRHIGGQSRVGLAALDRASGLATSFRADVEPPQTSDIDERDGVVWVTGPFDTIGGAARDGIGAVTASGAVRAWAPEVEQMEGFVRDISAVAKGAGPVYVGGRLWNGVGGAVRFTAAALDPDSALAAGWNPDPYRNYGSTVFAPRVRALKVLDNGDIAIAGFFDRVEGGAVPNLAIVGQDGLATSWRPGVLSEQLALDAAPGRLAAGGYGGAALYRQGSPPVAEGPAGIGPAGLTFPALRCTAPRWRGNRAGERYEWRWLRDEAVIPGRTAHLSALVPADSGHRFRCEVRIVNAEGSTVVSSPDYVAGTIPGDPGPPGGGTGSGSVGGGRGGGGSGGGPPPPAGKSQARVLVVAGQRLRGVLRRGLKLRLIAGTNPVTLRLILTLSPAEARRLRLGARPIVARATVALRAGAGRTVRVRPTRRARAKLVRARRVRLLLRVAGAQPPRTAIVLRR